MYVLVTARENFIKERNQIRDQLLFLSPSNTSKFSGTEQICDSPVIKETFSLLGSKLVQKALACILFTILTCIPGPDILNFEQKRPQLEMQRCHLQVNCCSAPLYMDPHNRAWDLIKENEIKFNKRTNHAQF
ncbi:hypothetical protein HHI36_002996 [Cryptolaemus montrouzieri]|uniref:Uncharacterized protein n=1 Tax=Cryptolaemus montrouzieri TaxID=559131 RepID=A0ABD2PCN3_9CUCU